MRDFLRAAGSVVLAALLCGGVAADTIYMKNGSVIRGTVVGYANGEFTVQLTGAGGSRSRATLAGDDIERIEFEGDAGSAPVGRQDPPKQEPLARGADPVDAGSPDDGSDPDPAGAQPPLSSGRDSSPAPAVRGGSGGDTIPATAARRESSVTVDPRADWTNTQFLLRRGARVRITATGSVKLDGAGKRSSGPAGTELADRDKLMPSRPTGALIAVIGDDNDDFIFIGTQAEFVSQRDGYLFLSVNEGNLKDNSGSYAARVSVEGAQPASPAPRTGATAPPVSRDPAPVARDPQPAAPPARTTDRPSQPAAGSSVRDLDVVVQSNIDWTNTKIRVQRGNVIRVTATGTVTLSPGGSRTGPAGIERADKDKLIQSGPTGGLIAVVGDDNDDFIYLGASGQFTSRHDGVLFLSVNEGNLRDNVGTFNARVSVEQTQIENAGSAGAAPAPAGGGGGAATPVPAPATKPASPAIGPNGGTAELTIQAKSDWTGTGIAIRKGMKIRISATGSVKLDRAGRVNATPAGTAEPDPLKLIADKPTGALIAVIGDDNSEYIFVGTGIEFTATRDGVLYLGINEGEVSDNTGAFVVRVVVTKA